MKIDYDNRQKKIYEDYSDSSNEELLKIVDKKNSYLSEVVEVVKDILNERNEFPDSGEDVRLNEPVIEKKEVKNSQITYAGFWVRFFAWVIDQLILGIPVFIAYGQFNESFRHFMYAIGVLYWVGFEVFASGTPGKLICGLKIKSIEGNRLEYHMAFFRVILKFLSILILGIGVIIIAFSKKKQGLHDIIIKSVVIDNAKNIVI